MSEIYFSVDIETDGPIPGINSMLSLGAAAFDGTGKMIDTYTINLEELRGAISDADTMKWWETQPEAWKACRASPISPDVAMPMFASWVKSVAERGGGKPVFVGYPAGFDFLFVYWYLIRFLGSGKSPFSFSALDIKTYAMALMRCGYREVTKQTMKKYVSKSRPHTHVAIDDAIEQGELFFALKKANEERSPS